MSDEDDNEEDRDPFCARCGQQLPVKDEDDEAVNRRVDLLRTKIAQQCAYQARERFILVGELRAQRGLTHPRLRRVRGEELRVGWLLSTSHKSSWGDGQQRRWDVIVSIADNNYVHILGLDPQDGRSSYTSSTGVLGEHWVDDLEIDGGAHWDSLRGQEGT